MAFRAAVIVLLVVTATWAAPFNPEYNPEQERRDPSTWEVLKEGAKDVFHVGQHSHPAERLDYHNVEYPADPVQRAALESQRIAHEVAARERFRRQAGDQKDAEKEASASSSNKSPNEGEKVSASSDNLPPQGALEIMFKQQKEREDKLQPTFIEELKSGWDKAAVVPATQLGEKLEEAKEKGRETFDQAKQKVAEGWDATKEGATNAGEKVRETFSRDKNTKIAVPPAQSAQ